MKKVILCLIVSKIFYSCTKPVFEGKNCLVNCITFSGVIREGKTKTGVADVEVKVLYRKLYSIVLTPVLCTTKTDAQGNFSLTFDGSDFKSFTNGYLELEAKKNGFLTGEADGTTIFDNIDSTKFGTVIPVDIGIYPSANLKIRLKIAYQDANRSIAIEHKYAHTRYGFYNKPQVPIDTVMNIQTAGNQFVIIQSRVSAPNSIISTKTDSVFIKAGETGNYLLEY
jgi:hypothetical protein